MAFRKFAYVSSLGTFDADAAGHLKSASSAAATADTPRSYYSDGARKLAVKDLLEKNAERYEISPNPRDYIFEAIRANTANVPNENHDAFEKAELLRFAHRLGMPVYMTYAGKPHHVNHRTENPKRARGLIIDAHYNDDAPPLDLCPGCHSKTADKRARDASGIHCKKCGAVVKDEFVEILVAVDTKKDPAFAEGVRTGALKAGSMGCNCASTECNVCGHIAYSRPEFCEHIKSGNKGSLWQEQENGSWKKIDKQAAKTALSGARMELAPDFCYVTFTPRSARAGSTTRPLAIRKAYEKCLDVEFDEYSRVDQPADPKALQREILKAASARKDAEQQESLAAETEALMRNAQRARKGAQMGTPPSGPGDLTAETTFEEVLPDNSKVVRETQPDGTTQVTIVPSGAVPGGPGGPGGPGEPEMDMDNPTLDDLNQEQLTGMPPDAPPPSAQNFGLAPPPGSPPGSGGSSMPPGVSPPGASARGASRSRQPMPFARAYSNWTVDVTARGNAKIVSPEGPVALIRARKSASSTTAHRAFGKEVLAHLLTHGLVRTVRAYKALMGPKLASMLDDALNDMKGVTRGQPNKGVSFNGDDDLTGLERGSYSSSTGIHQGGEPDHKRKDPSAKGNVHSKGEQDHERSVPADAGNAQDDADNDMQEKRSPKSVGSDSVLDDPIRDRKASFRVVARSWLDANRDRDPSGESWLATPAGSGYLLSREGEALRQASAADFKAQWVALDKTPVEEAKKLAKHEERLKRLYQARLDKVATASDAERKQIAAEAVDRFARALRIVAARQRLGLEDDPMKEAVATVLANRRVVGQSAEGQDLMWVPISDDLAIHLTESAWAEGQDRYIDDLLGRAAKLAERSDEYLKDAQGDLSNRTQRIASITSPEQVTSTPNLDALEARQAARSGNFAFGPTPPEYDVPDEGMSKSAALRSALGGTRTGNLKRQIRAS